MVVVVGALRLMHEKGFMRSYNFNNIRSHRVGECFGTKSLCGIYHEL
jgi:hypothetical protein